jgi:hypothetical protein
MRSFPKSLAALAAAGIGLIALGGIAFAGKKDDDKAKAPDKKDVARKADDKTAKDDKKPDEKRKDAGKLDVPVSKDHDAKGVKIPYFDGDGKQQMVFTIGVASRVDESHVQMTDTQVETFDENGEHEMTIDLPTSVLDVNTSEISTKKHVAIKREDFELTGETMKFNMKTKQGTLGGGVRMLIYNLDDEAPAPTQAPPAAPVTPAPPALKSP